MADYCVACDRLRLPGELATFPGHDGSTGHVCLSAPDCLRTIAATLPEPGADEPPVGFAATRVRAERLADATGRPRPDLGEPRRKALGDGTVSVWHWADPDD